MPKIDFENLIIKMLDADKMFYAGFWCGTKRTESTEIPTIGTTYHQNGEPEVFYNPKYLSIHSEQTQIALLEHETLHVLLACKERLGTRDPIKWNIAQDLAINQYIKNLPENGQFIEKYGFKEGLCAEEYYNLLPKQPTTRGCERKEHNFSEKERAEILLKAEKALLKDQFSANLKIFIEQILSPTKIPWQTILRQGVSRVVETDKKSSWRRPNRKLGEGYKGRVVTCMPKVGIGIDTSGSIGTEKFQQFIKEIISIQKLYSAPFTVIEADNQIQKIYELSKHKKVQTTFEGGGGTDFRPLFEEFSKRRISLLIFFTDTQGILPNKPKFCTIWATTQKAEMPFGKVVVVGEEK